MNTGKTVGKGYDTIEKGFNMRYAFFGVVCLIILGVLILTIRENMHQTEMIRSGMCEISMSQLYTPPPSMICSAYNSDGVCTMYVPVQSDPYMRNYWECSNGESFWRRQ